jgi:predicted Zn-dependent protease with MMP-like domain
MRLSEIAASDFDQLVSRALDDIPDELASVIENCVILVEDFPPPGQPMLLGLYEGVPLTARGDTYAAVLPDRITIFRGPILGICDTVQDVVQEVHVTVVHEIAHHFGIDDARLHELGYA